VRGSSKKLSVLVEFAVQFVGCMNFMVVVAAPELRKKLKKK